MTFAENAGRSWLLAVSALLICNFGLPLTAQSLEEELRLVPARELAEQAKREGDASRGAVVFFQHHLACSKCHSVGNPKPNPLGPDLATLGKDVTDDALVESVLQPSLVLRKGFETITVLTADGRTIHGILHERTKDRLVLREASRLGELTTLATADIDETQVSKISLMPAGQVNSLASRQQFLDLIRYLIEIRTGGALRAKELQPPAALVAFVLPEYEQRLDHAGLIRGFNSESLQRGEKIYQRVCANCHGTKDKAGSLPTSLRFAEGKFKNGHDPLAMYRTLTHGFGLMTPQTWMVPSQKYDVIHYIRETYLRPHNRAQYSLVDDAYLTKLPAGNTRGPEPSRIERWSAMDYGPSLTHTYEIPGRTSNIAYKGIAIRLDAGSGGVARGRWWQVFDTDTLRMAAAWQTPNADLKRPQEPGFIDWQGIQFNGAHGVHPRIVGEVTSSNSSGPGWANPATGKFDDDQRVLGRDGRRYGPLPRSWAKYRGLYHHDQQTFISYTVGSADVLESPGLLTRDDPKSPPVFLRTFNIGPRERDLVLQVAEHPSADAVLTSIDGDESGAVVLAGKSKSLLAGVAPANSEFGWTSDAGRLRLKIAAGHKPLRFTVWQTSHEGGEALVSGKKLASEALASVADIDLKRLTTGSPPRWPEKLTTTPIIGEEGCPFAVDVLTAPEANPWLAQTRFTGLDFFADGRLAVCSWDGDVWIVEQLKPTSAEMSSAPQLRWQRIASGLFQPLGLKIVAGKIHVTCRDQLAVLHDLNGDGETDFYECLNNDHQVTEHFHEFAMGLQTDAAGNFYYAKSARHALKAVVPQHGTLLRVSADGQRTEIIANGFRAANGVCLNPDGSFVVTDQEGHWNPKNRINWVTLDPTGKPKFYGNLFGYHDVTDASDAAMQPPLCWITNAFDRSPAELLRVTSERWGPLQGSLLNLSYGYGKVFVVPHERVGETMQGGLIELPLPVFPTGIMRGRFNPIDGQLYACGMFAWAGNATHPGGLYRIRATGQPIYLPTELQATKRGLRLTFTAPLDSASIDVKNIQVTTWSLKRTAGYGSAHHDTKTLVVRGVELSKDGKLLTLDVADLQPTWCMEIKYKLRAATGEPIVGTLHNTIHQLSD